MIIIIIIVRELEELESFFSYIQGFSYKEVIFPYTEIGPESGFLIIISRFL